jgi:hypothetical protein
MKVKPVLSTTDSHNYSWMPTNREILSGFSIKIKSPKISNIVNNLVVRVTVEQKEYFIAPIAILQRLNIDLSHHPRFRERRGRTKRTEYKYAAIQVLLEHLTIEPGMTVLFELFFPSLKKVAWAYDAKIERF